MYKDFLITSVDVKQVAKDLRVEISEEQIEQVIAQYPSALENDPTGLWCQIIEQCFYDLEILP